MVDIGYTRQLGQPHIYEDDIMMRNPGCFYLYSLYWNVSRIVNLT
jgi:hypothetical protein